MRYSSLRNYEIGSNTGFMQCDEGHIENIARIIYSEIDIYMTCITKIFLVINHNSVEA